MQLDLPPVTATPSTRLFAVQLMYARNFFLWVQYKKTHHYIDNNYMCAGGRRYVAVPSLTVILDTAAQHCKQQPTALRAPSRRIAHGHAVPPGNRAGEREIVIGYVVRGNATRDTVIIYCPCLPNFETKQNKTKQNKHHQSTWSMFFVFLSVLKGTKLGQSDPNSISESLR